MAERAFGSRAGELVKSTGGCVPAQGGDAPLAPAFTHVAPRSMPLPVLIAVPHAGRAYPSHVLEAMRDRELCQLRLEDRHVDRLGVAIARETGTGLLVAHAPRAMLDLNRAQDDIDWEMVQREREQGKRGRDPAMPPLVTRRRNSANYRARSGLGLVPRRLPGFGEIWRAPIGREELEARIERIHRPYHEFLTAELERIRDEWGCALLIDLHSMPPLRRQSGEARAPSIVLGDRFGASCASALLARAFRFLGTSGYEAAHNRPYSGGYVLDRHAAPARGVHAIQIEVCRSAYLDRNLSEVSPGLEPLAAMLAGLVRELGAETARMADGGRLDEAAE
jgi:N-formylglutamate amidohydrolase